MPASELHTAPITQILYMPDKDKYLSLSKVVTCPLPRRFVHAQVEQLCEVDMKLRLLPIQRVADKFAEAILTSFRLELSLNTFWQPLLFPSRPLDSELRRRLQTMRTAFPVLLGGRSDELLAAWYDCDELVGWVAPSQPQATNVPQGPTAVVHAELTTKHSASPKQRPSRRVSHSESPWAVGGVTTALSVASSPLAAGTSCPLLPTTASVASTITLSTLAHPPAAAAAAAAASSLAAAAVPVKLRAAAAPPLSTQKLGAWVRGEALPLPRHWSRKLLHESRRALATPPPTELAPDHRPAAPPRHAASSHPPPSCPKCATAAASTTAAASAIAPPLTLTPRGPPRPTPGLTRLQALAYSPRYDAVPLPPLPPPLPPPPPPPPVPEAEVEVEAEEAGGCEALPSEVRPVEAREVSGQQWQPGPVSRASGVKLLAAGRPVVFDVSGTVRSAEQRAAAGRGEMLLAATEVAGASVAVKLLLAGAAAAEAAAEAVIGPVIWRDLAISRDVGRSGAMWSDGLKTAH